MSTTSKKIILYVEDSLPYAAVTDWAFKQSVGCDAELRVTHDIDGALAYLQGLNGYSVTPDRPGSY
ncbi:MAG: hypothetical protein L0387_02585 [Acidobacteria bacterium]|nr:hypothetical protein [Acidobacteriota bacterium]